MFNIIMGFRETLEAVLIIMILYSFLKKNKIDEKIKFIYYGTFSGIGIAILMGSLINFITLQANESGEIISKIWEGTTELITVVLILSILLIMIKGKKNIKNNINNRLSEKISSTKLYLITTFLIAREGCELVLFVLGGTDTDNIFITTMIGILLALIVAVLIYKSLIDISISKIFEISMYYLILQCGYLAGGTIHEFLEVLQMLDFNSNSIFLYGNLYDLSNTILDRKSSIIEILLNGILGWNSKPQIIPFIIQYTLTFVLFYKVLKNKN